MAVIVQDTFTDTPATAIGSHTPNVGTIDSSSNFEISASGTELRQSSTTCTVYYTEAAPSWDFTASLTFDVLEDTAAGAFSHDFVAYRHASTATTYGYLRLTSGTSTTTWALLLVHNIASGGYTYGTGGSGGLTISGGIATGKYTANFAMVQTGFTSGQETFDVTVEFIRESDGFYLKSDGTWQSGQTFAMTGTYDDTDAVSNHSSPIGATPGKGPGISVFDFVDKVNYDQISLTTAGGLEVDPTEVIKSSTGNALVLTDDSASWTPGTPGSPVVTVDVGTITAQVTVSSTEIDLTYDAPGTAETATFTVGSDTVEVEVTEPPTLTSGTASFTEATASSCTATCTAPSGNVGSVTYQWKRSTSYNGTYADVSGQTSLTMTDSTVTPGTEYWWYLEATDSLSRTVTSNIVLGATWAGTTLVLGFIGDSITLGVTSAPIVDYCVEELSGLGKLRKVTAPVNDAVGGTQSTYWADGDTPLDDAVDDFIAAGVTHVSYMIGANDHHNTAGDNGAYQTAVQGTADRLVAEGFKVILHAPTYANSAWTDDSGRQALFDCQAILDTICASDPTNILVGDRLGFNLMSANSALTSDGVHLSTDGGIVIGALWAYAIANAVGDIETGGGGGGGVSGARIFAGF